MPVTTDTRPVNCTFFDRDNQRVGQMLLRPRLPSEAPRRIIFGGKVFIEGDGTGFYGENEFAELVDV